MKLPKKRLILPSLPYHYDGLEPITSSAALKIHYTKHHAGYVKKFNGMIKNGGSRADLEFNYSGHVLHTRFWDSFTPYITEPGPKTMKAIKDPGFFISKLVDTAMNIKGSGWAVAALSKGKVIIVPIANHDLRNIAYLIPLVVLDAWEHSYYADYANKKKEYFNSIVDLINWDTVESSL
jgi:superoxide dismutase, Fe-Mn family